MVTRRHSIRRRSYDALVVNVVGASGIPAAILAHQGGWDEMLLVVGPIIFIVVVLGIVKRRVDRTQQPPPT